MAHRETKRHRDAFEVWWSNDRDVQAVCKQCAVHRNSVNHWMDWFSWHKRADDRDARAREKLDRQKGLERAREIAEAQKQTKDAGRLLLARGQGYLLKKELEHGKDAIGAMKAGVDMIRQAAGVPTEILALLNTNEAELTTLLSSLVTGAPDGPDGGGAGTEAGHDLAGGSPAGEAGSGAADGA